jgi:hypothetical protein
MRGIKPDPMCRRMQIHVESVQAGFPDSIALQRVGGKERRIRIEFEFRSSSFRALRAIALLSIGQDPANPA